MVMHMFRWPVLLVITLVLIAGCTSPVPKDTSPDNQTMGSVEGYRFFGIGGSRSSADELRYELTAEFSGFTHLVM